MGHPTREPILLNFLNGDANRNLIGQGRRGESEQKQTRREEGSHQRGRCREDGGGGTKGSMGDRMIRNTMGLLQGGQETNRRVRITVGQGSCMEDP